MGKQVEFILQGKGGVGKSLIASLIAQHFLGRGLSPLCIDTDPVNATFAGYAAFQGQTLDLMEGDDINPRIFDTLVETIMDEDSGVETIIIDNGASTFVPLCSYLLQNGVVNLLREAGHNLRFHSVITGGQALADTSQGFDSLCGQIPDVPVVVWMNEFFGRPVQNGKKFEDSNLFKRHKDRIHALVTIPVVKAETYGHDMEKMLKAKMTFAEVDTSPDFRIMERQRLRIMWRTLDGQMERARL